MSNLCFYRKTFHFPISLNLRKSIIGPIVYSQYVQSVSAVRRANTVDPYAVVNTAGINRGLICTNIYRIYQNALGGNCLQVIMGY